MNHPRSGMLVNLFADPFSPTNLQFTNTARTIFDTTVENIFRKITFKPLSIEELHTQGLDFQSAQATMKQQGINNVEIINVETDEGHVQILYARHPSEASNPKLAVFVHGQEGAATRQIYSGEVFENWKQGKSICLTSLRGYMGNPGKPDHKGQADDLAKILGFLLDTKGIVSKNTELYAHSMGCDTLANALAIRATQTTGLVGDTYRRIDLRAPYTNIAAMIKRKIMHKPYLWEFIPFIKPVIKSLEPLIMDSFANLKHLRAEHIQISASEADKKVPYRMSRAVHEELNRLNKAINTSISFTKHPLHLHMDHNKTCLYHLNA